MHQGFVRISAMTPKIKVADCDYNVERICELIDEAVAKDAKVIVFPELCITGYTCGDLFLQDTLLKGAIDGLIAIAKHTENISGVLVWIGLPYEYCGKLYNVAATISGGKILGFVPKKNIPNNSEFYEKRHFTEGFDKVCEVTIDGQIVPFGSKILYKCTNMPSLVIGTEICEDLWVPMPPSIAHAMNGANVIINCSASNETISKDNYRRELVRGQSARLLCAYIYASAGEGESTQDLVFGGHNIIAENGTVIAEAKRFMNEAIYADVDLDKLKCERRRMTTFSSREDLFEYTTVVFHIEMKDLELIAKYNKAPFVPSDKREREDRCEAILSIQALGLKKRLEHIGCKSAVIGISGGLDSTLALLVMIRAFDSLHIPRENIISVTMPCFGTTDRTYSNAVELTKKLGATLREIDIKESVTLHFRDINHDANVHDVTYENAQARERTQVLMDIANQTNGIVIGTGDLSELALGWATYNGDHMSMYDVNVSVPKTLVRHLVKYFADTCKEEGLADVLNDVLDTPVSPELLPPKANGTIAQKTEDIVGPYELHDFYLYHILRFGIRPAKLFRIAKNAFEGEYEDETILKWLKTFYSRFFAHQFKRSCLPDGPKVGSVSISPRGDLRMPSDASASLWLKELEEL